MIVADKFNTLLAIVYHMIELLQSRWSRFNYSDPDAPISRKFNAVQTCSTCQCPFRVLMSWYFELENKKLQVYLFIFNLLSYNYYSILLSFIILSRMGACASARQQKSNFDKDKKDKEKFTPQEINKLNLKVLVKRLQQKFKRYRKQTLQQSQNYELIMLEQQIRNIYMGLIKEKIMLANQNKITMKQCKIEISQEMLQVQIMVLKHVEAQLRGEENVDIIKKFYSEIGSFLVTLARFLKTIYPRGESVEAGQLAKRFKEFDNTEDFEYDILKNAGFVFSSEDHFDITKTIKQFLNRIMKELDDNFGAFYEMIEGIDPGFKIGRKISQNTSRYLQLDTGTVQIKSTEVARVLIKWMQDLSETLNYAQQKVNIKNEYKFYKSVPEENRIQFSKCQDQTLTKIINGGLINCMQDEKNQSKKKAEQRKSKFRKFNMHLIRVFNQIEHKQSEVSRQEMEVIKYSFFNNSFITWMVEEELVQTIIHLIRASSQYQEFRGTLDIIKFKINDLMRCQIFGDRKKIVEVFNKFKDLEEKDVLQIVKIKNRFSTPMGDAMIFLKMPTSFIICQCQLILSQQNKGQDAKKAKNIETLNHFLYELQRSPFGVLGQISVFLTAKSQTVSSYCDKINMFLMETKAIQNCLKLHRKQLKQSKKKFKQQKSPFVCSKCLKFFKKFSNKMKTHYCEKCIVFLCNKCTNDEFSITEDMINTTLSKKIQMCIDDTKKSKIYRKNPEKFESAFGTVTGQQLIRNCFTYQKISEINILKDSFKDGKIKIASIIDYICSKEHYVKVFMEKGVKVNFVIITWRGDETRLKCYKYDHDHGYIVNAFQAIQKYETHEFMDVNSFDLFGEFENGEFCTVNQKNRDFDDFFQLKARSQIQRGIYVFEGQNKQSTIQEIETIPEDQRHKYLLKTYRINEQFFLIIDIDHSLKRSQEVNKIKEHLNQVSKNQLKKVMKMTDMNITDRTLGHFYEHKSWTNKIKVLNLSDNNISEISIIFELCSNLQKLNISRNRFVRLRFSKQLPSLQQLDASENNIQKIINFSNIKKIVLLKLQSNKLSALTKWVDGKKISPNLFFRKQIQRRTTQQAHQQLLQDRSFLSSFFGACEFPTVHRTQIDSSELIALQNSEFLSHKHEEYEIVEREQKIIDASDSFSYLRQLILANNEFTSMVESAEGFFPNLTFLNLNDNLIDEIPELNLDKIEEIHLANNRIEQLSKFAKVDNSSLGFLGLRNNRITKLPRLNFHSLVKTDLSYNRLEDIEAFITGNYFQDLTHLYLSYIKIDALTNLPKLIKVLSLQNCQLNDEKLDKFVSEVDFPKLKELYLTRNKLTRLPRIDRLQKINSLYLQENPIKDISLLDRQGEQRKAEIQTKATKENKKAKDDDDDEKSKKKQKKKGLYLYLSNLWISFEVPQDDFQGYKQKLEKYLENTKTICWKYDSVFGVVKQRPKRKFFLFETNETFYKQLMIKRNYLLNVFDNEHNIKDRYKLTKETGFYQLDHAWQNIDMDEFVKHDWNEIEFIDLRGTGMDDKKWRIFADNAYLFPNLKDIRLWDHKITTINEGDLQKITKLQQISFFQNNTWSNPLTELSKHNLRKYKQSHPQVIVKFEEEVHIKTETKTEGVTQFKIELKSQKSNN